MTELRLILGDQLNPHHSWFDTCSPNVIYVMLELRAETAYVLHHAQKIIAIFAAMRAFAAELKEKGHRVRYVRLSEGSNRGTLEDNLNALIAHYHAGRVMWQEPDEWRLDAQLQAWAKTATVETTCVSSEHFFTSREQVSAFFASRKSWRMEYFYREMRRQHGVLLTPEGEPEGGNGISMLKTASAGPVNRLLRMTLASATIAQHYGKRSNAAAYAPLANRRPTLFAGQSTVLKLKPGWMRLFRTSCPSLVTGRMQCTRKNLFFSTL